MFKQLIKIGQSKMFDYVSVNLTTGETAFAANASELQKESIKEGAAGNPAGFFMKHHKMQFGQFMKHYKLLDLPTKTAIDNWAINNIEEFNRCLNL
jgi:hypothetical protein